MSEAVCDWREIGVEIINNVVRTYLIIVYINVI